MLILGWYPVNVTPVMDASQNKAKHMWFSTGISVGMWLMTANVT